MVKLLLVFFLTYLFTHGYAQPSAYALNQVKLLKEALAYYETLNPENWTFFSCDSCVNPQEKSQLNLLLRRNLLLTGDLALEFNTTSDTLDKNLEKALKQYQKRHGLVEDGILGPATLNAFNIPLSARISQLRDNITHWKAFSDTIMEPFVFVNIPDLTLAIIDSGKIDNRMKVIVGRITNPTPTFISRIHSIVIHPSWKVPHSIATREILPMVKKSPDYLHKTHLKVYAVVRNKKVELDPDSILWQNVSLSSFNYYFEQIPGSWNALGKLKFLFKNEHNVYLHDTPEKYLFSHNKRTYSHGCVRIEKPTELAAWLLKTDVATVEKMIHGNIESKTLIISRPIPVAIENFTSWIDENGLLHFRQELYPNQRGH